MSKIIKRPWGAYVIIAKSKDFLLKKITVKPEGVLSYQSHNYRSEHWIIIEGNESIMCNNRHVYYVVNEHVGVPSKAKHRVIKERSQPLLVLFSLPSLSKFLESDIKRFSDIYGRSQ